jgi:hypothetical protein
VATRDIFVAITPLGIKVTPPLFAIVLVLVTHAFPFQ